MKTYIGILRLLAEMRLDGTCSCRPHEFHTDDGRVIKPIKRCDDVPLEQRIEIVLDDNLCVVDWSLADSVLANFGDPNKTIGLFWFADEDTVEIRQTLVEGYARRLQDFYRYWSRGKWEVAVDGHAIVTDERPGLHRQGAWTVIDAHLNDKGLSYKYLHGIGGFANVCGHAFVLGTKAWSYCLNDKVIAHETGHNLGGRHAGAFGQEYGETEMILGGGQQTGSGFNFPHAAFFQWTHEASAEVLTPDTSKVFFLLPPNAQSADLRPGETKGVVVLKPHARYVAGGVMGTDRVHIYKQPSFLTGPTGAMATTMVDARLSPGQSATLEQGVTFEHLGVKEGAAKVVAKWKESLAYTDRDWPKLVTGSDNLHPLVPGIFDALGLPGQTETGSPLQGLNVYVLRHRTPNELLVHWYTWDFRHEQRWYKAQGPIENNIARMTVYTTRRGAPSAREMTEIGTARLYLYDADHGLFRYETSEHGRGHLQLGRINTPVPHDLYGVFEAVGRELEGLAITINRDDKGQEDLLYAYWFGYQRISSAFTTGMNQRWLTVSGRIGETLKIGEPKNGYFSVHSRPDPTEELWGEGEIKDGVFSFAGKESGSFGLNKLTA